VSVFARISTACALLFAVAGCSTPHSPDLASGPSAYAIMPAPDPNAVPVDYVIGPDDQISVQVFQEPDLSSDKIKVDNVGNIQIQLIGQVEAAGRTAPQLAQEIAARLGQRFLVNPQVVVSVVEPAAHFFTVEGQVKRPGIYEIGDDFTLLSAIARAESTTQIAKLNEVIIFRDVQGKRMGAVFNLTDIRKGRAPDPQLLAGDKIVVGFSAVKGAYRDFLQMAPLFNLFTQF
jgi:polysaccharide export outer membrane protein